MLLTNIRIEAPSNRPSPLQNWLTMGGTMVEAAAYGWGLLAPFQLCLMMYRVNRSLTKALFPA